LFQREELLTKLDVLRDAEDWSAQHLYGSVMRELILLGMQELYHISRVKALAKYQNRNLY